MTEVINQSRTDAGFEIPWGVALAAFQPQNATEAEAIILDAQLDVIQNDPLVFAGPNTDLLGVDLRYDNIHFDEEGLREHAAGWVDAVLPLFIPKEFALADLNLDGTVDIADLTIFRANFNEKGTNRLTGDFNGDVVTDLPDFVQFRERFNEQAVVSNSSVPEPATFSLLGFGVLLLLSQRRARPTA